MARGCAADMGGEGRFWRRVYNSVARGCAADMGGGGGFWRRVYNSVARGCAADMGGGGASRGGCITVWPVVVLRTWGGEGLLEAGV